MPSPSAFSWSDATFTSAAGEPIFVYEITMRVGDGLHLLAPDDPELTALVWGVLARAADRYDVEIYSVHALSNHVGILAGFTSAAKHARFKQFVGSNIARETNIRRNRSGRVWERPARSIQVDSDERILERLGYNLGNGCVENLVERPEMWPGVHAAKPLLNGLPGVGKWINRSAFWKAGGERRGKDLQDFAVVTTLHFSKIPSLRDLTDTEYTAQVRALCDAAVVERRKKAKGRAALGVKRLTKESAWLGRTPMTLRTGCAPETLCPDAVAKRVRAKAKAKGRFAPRVHSNSAERRAEHRKAYNAHVGNLRRLRGEIAEALECGSFDPTQLASIQPQPT